MTAPTPPKTPPKKPPGAKPGTPAKTPEQRKRKAKSNEVAAMLSVFLIGFAVTMMMQSKTMFGYRLKAMFGGAGDETALGEIYLFGVGLDENYQNFPVSGAQVDYAEALKWLQSAAAGGDARAESRIGLMYGRGWGVPENHEESRKWFLSAAEKGLGLAEFNMGVTYAVGDGVPRDFKQAEMWHRRGAEHGYPGSMLQLGHILLEGLGEKKDPAEALFWYRKVADLGVPQGQMGIGTIYLRGEGVARDYAEARNWFLKAAQQQYASAEINLGLMHVFGIGTPHDCAEAEKWFDRAAAHGDMRAKLIAARCLLSDISPEANAAEMNVLKAQFIGEAVYPAMQAAALAAQKGPQGPPRTVTDDSLPGWTPEPALEKQAMDAAEAYLAAIDSGNSEKAYAMMTAAMRDATPKDALAQYTHDFNAATGKLVKRKVTAVTWTKDSPEAPLYGTYATIDIAARYDGVDRDCGYILLYQEPGGGEFRINHAENNFIANAQAQDIVVKQSKQALDKAWADMLGHCPNYSPPDAAAKP